MMAVFQSIKTENSYVHIATTECPILVRDDTKVINYTLIPAQDIFKLLASVPFLHVSSHILEGHLCVSLTCIGSSLWKKHPSRFYL